MATTITSGNATNGAAISSDNTGILELKTGTGAGTTALTIGTDQSVNFSGTGQRITGDFSNLTFANRVAFQSSTTNGNTTITALPNGTATTGVLEAYNAADPTNAQFGHVQANPTDIRIQSGARGTGTSSYLPMTFYTGGSERFRIGTSGQLGVAGANYGTAGQALVSNGASSAPSWQTVASAPDVQTFNSSGTWTKPSTGNFVRIQMWGGGGGGSRQATATTADAGGGGGYYETTLPIASMGATAAVTVGAAGAGRTGSAGNGTVGGNSGVTLGSGSTIYVSGGGAGATFPGDGGYGALVFSTTAVADPTNIGRGGGNCFPMDGYSYTGGGGGMVGFATGGKGGWGGGGGSYGTGSGGTSIFGGAGGNASTDGTAPGGGGGCSTAANTNGTNGAVGRVIITTF